MWSFSTKKGGFPRDEFPEGDVMKGDVIRNPATFRGATVLPNSGYLERSCQNNRSSQCHEIGLRMKLITFRDGNGCPLHILEDRTSTDGYVPKQILNNVYLFWSFHLYLSNFLL